MSLFSTLRISKVCHWCGVPRPLSYFVLEAQNGKKYYTYICKNCRQGNAGLDNEGLHNIPPELAKYIEENQFENLQDFLNAIDAEKSEDYKELKELKEKIEKAHTEQVNAAIDKTPLEKPAVEEKNNAAFRSSIFADPRENSAEGHGVFAHQAPKTIAHGQQLTSGAGDSFEAAAAKAMGFQHDKHSGYRQSFLNKQKNVKPAQNPNVTPTKEHRPPTMPGKRR